MFQHLVKRAHQLPKDRVLNLDRKEMIYYSPLKQRFPNIKYFFLEPDLFVIGDVEFPPGKRFIQVVSKKDLNRIKGSRPILVSRENYNIVKRRFPDREIMLATETQFILNKDLLLLVLLYLPRVDFLQISTYSGFKRLLTVPFWREKIKTDFPHASGIDRKGYLNLFAANMTLPEAIEYGYSTCPDLSPFSHKMAVAFGMMRVEGKCEQKVKDILSDKDFENLLLSVRLHNGDEELTIVTREMGSRLSEQLPQKISPYDIWYFTPEIIQRVIKLGPKPINIPYYIMRNLAEYLSPDPSLYLHDTYPEDVSLNYLAKDFYFWNRESDERKKFLGPLLERAGKYPAKVVYEIKYEPMTQQLAEDLTDRPDRNTFDGIDNPLTGLIHRGNKYYLSIQEYVNSKDHKFEEEAEIFGNEDDNDINITFVPVESQIYSIHEQPRKFEVEET